MGFAERPEHEWYRKNIIIPPLKAYRQLIKNIRFEGLAAFAAGKQLDIDWFVGTQMEYDADLR